MFVRGAQKQHLMSTLTQVTGIEVSRQLAANQVTKMLDPIDIGNGGCDQMTGHRVPAGLLNKVTFPLTVLCRQIKRGSVPTRGNNEVNYLAICAGRG